MKKDSNNTINHQPFIMKKLCTIILAGTVSILMLSCNGSNSKDANSNTNTTETPVKDDIARQGETAIDNAGKAKPPKGTITFTIDGQSYAARESSVQCMFVGIGNANMAQGIISGNGNGFTISGTMMTKPQTGELKSKGAAPVAGLSIIKDGVQYNSMPNGAITINVTKINQDGNNHYIGGTFSGTLQSQNGKEITAVNGVFESAYL
jgi:hypothetical protein